VLAAARAGHPKSGVRFGQGVIVGEFFASLDRPPRYEIPRFIKANIAFARMVEEPLYRQFVEVEIFRRNEPRWRADAKVTNLSLQVFIELVKFLPSHQTFIIFFLHPIGYMLSSPQGRDGKNADSPRVNERRAKF
jgi:hypothetical protein